MTKFHERLLLRIKRWINPAEWNANLLDLPKSHGTASSPGLVMIQIDGFSRGQLHKAFEKDEMPFLKSLLEKQGYQLHPYYPGLPSATPAVQGELFYGVRQCVPAFFFFDKQSQKVFRMFDGADVEEMEERLMKQGKSLLEGGSSYSNIFKGGAKEAHFCAGSLGWQKIWKDINPANMVLLAATHFFVFLRIVILLCWEIILASMDFICGLITKEDFVTEIKFIPLRTFLCVLLRELISLGARVDIARGLPIIHLNFLGYDEQAHRRGPSSPTAHWALKGIDAAIARIYHSAINSTRRNYDVWVYSDHGQEETIPYVGHFGKTVNDAVAEVFGRLFPSKATSLSQRSATVKDFEKKGVQLQRIRYFGGLIEKLWPLKNHLEKTNDCPPLVVSAIGPVGYVNLFTELNLAERHLFAREMVQSAKIPLVIIPEANGRARAWNERGEFVLPEQAKEVIGSQHAYLEEVTRDLIDICHHPNAGEFTLCGWDPTAKPFSFPFENGAHAGPGTEETNAFALLPADVKTLNTKRDYLKTIDLREAALRLLNRADDDTRNFSAITADPTTFQANQTIRVMTYNVHSCVGMDGKLLPQRTARVIASYNPDIVALQELDVRRPRTGSLDQAHFIAQQLKMIHHFHPSFQIEEEQYGNAVLSRFPLCLKSAASLPALFGKSVFEPRGAMWVEITAGDEHIQFINTHLSVFYQESLKQAKALLGKEWLSHPECQSPVILCGDFNAQPASSLCREIKKRFRDAQEGLKDYDPKATWFSYYPIDRIDHVFVSRDIEVVKVQVIQNDLSKTASDHLPLIVDIKIKR